MNDIRQKNHPRLSTGMSLLLALSLMFFMSFSAFTEVKLYRYMVVLVFVLLLFIAVRSKLVTILAALPCLLAFLGAEASPDLPLLLCAVAVIGFGGIAIETVHPLILSAAPVLSYLLAFGLTGDPIRALSILAFVPVAAVLALALHFRFSRTASIAAVSVAIFVCAALALMFISPYKENLLSSEFIDNFIATHRELLTTELMSMADSAEFSSVLGNVTQDDIASLTNTFLRLLPAILVVAVETVAYFACLIAVSLRSSQLPEHPLPPKCLAFRMSAVSAVLFLVSFVLLLLPTGNSDAIGIVLVTAMNLVLILMPGLAVCGVLRILASFYQKRAFSPILLIILLIWFSYLLPAILAFVGAFAILRTEKAARKDREAQN